MLDLGITPANDGSVIRLVIPALAEETRRDLAKEVKKSGSKEAIRTSVVMLWMKRRNKKKQKKSQEDELKVLKRDVTHDVTCG